MRYRITLYGFSEAECRAMRFALEYPGAGELGFEVVESLVDADFAIVDADVPAAVKAVALAGRVARGVYIGAAPPPEAPVVLPRPVDSARMRRSLLRLMARHGAESRSAQAPSTTDDPDEIIVFDAGMIGAIGKLPTRPEELPPMPAAEPAPALAPAPAQPMPMSTPSATSTPAAASPATAPSTFRRPPVLDSASPPLPTLAPRTPRVAPLTMVPVPPLDVAPPPAVDSISPPTSAPIAGPTTPPAQPPGGRRRFPSAPEVIDIADIPVLVPDLDAVPPDPAALPGQRPAAAAPAPRPTARAFPPPIPASTVPPPRAAAQPRATPPVAAAPFAAAPVAAPPFAAPSFAVPPAAMAPIPGPPTAARPAARVEPTFAPREPPATPLAPTPQAAPTAGVGDADIPENAPPGFIQRDKKSIARAAARAARLSHQQTDPGQLEYLRDVLLLDPDQAAAAALHELLELFGFRVHVARHIAQAADVLSRVPLVAAFVDVPVNGSDQGDGVTLLQTIQDLPRLINHPTPAVFLVSNELRPADRVRARLAGINVHLTKPVSRGEVARALEACEVLLPSDARRSSH